MDDQFHSLSRRLALRDLIRWQEQELDPDELA